MGQSANLQSGKSDVQIRTSVENSVLRVVNARELHEFLASKQNFSNWIKSRINKYDFIEGVDFICVTKSGEGTNQGFQAIEYFITLSMAKELAMVGSHNANALCMMMS